MMAVWIQKKKFDVSYWYILILNYAQFETPLAGTRRLLWEALSDLARSRLRARAAQITEAQSAEPERDRGASGARSESPSASWACAELLRTAVETLTLDVCWFAWRQE
jgi:hypothetical protein